MTEPRTWCYYLPSQDPGGINPYSLISALTSPEAVAEEAFEHYWNEHDGWELGSDQNYELILTDPGGVKTRWTVSAEQTISFFAEESE